MSQTLTAYLVTGAIFGVLDFAWLSVMSQRLYKAQLGPLMRDQLSLPPAILFYFVYITALTLLVVLPALRAGNSTQAMTQGAMLGLAAYATYNLTNASTLNGWPPLITFIDWTWGTVATAVAAWLAVLALRAIGVDAAQ